MYSWLTATHECTWNPKVPPQNNPNTDKQAEGKREQYWQKGQRYNAMHAEKRSKVGRIAMDMQFKGKEVCSRSLV
jgi:hypothetical protein